MSGETQLNNDDDVVTALGSILSELSLYFTGDLLQHLHMC